MATPPSAAQRLKIMDAIQRSIGPGTNGDEFYRWLTKQKTEIGKLCITYEDYKLHDPLYRYVLEYRKQLFNNTGASSTLKKRRDGEATSTQANPPLNYKRRAGEVSPGSGKNVLRAVAPRVAPREKAKGHNRLRLKVIGHLLPNASRYPTAR